MEGQEFILFGTTNLIGLVVIFAIMIAVPKITNQYFASKKELIGRVIAVSYTHLTLPTKRIV